MPAISPITLQRITLLTLTIASSFQRMDNPV